ncbi:MAG: AAA family ATPase, partial [Lachnospiraceae bacterium]|nr:AAA family ATPase [Lachnospiraceae bacterium]
AVYRICQIIQKVYLENSYLLESEKLTEIEKRKIMQQSEKIEAKDAPMAVNDLASYMMKHFGKKVIILLDEYDTPMQEAYVNGYWNEFTSFIRSLFNSTFKTNPYLERAVMTGITRVSKESIFSDLNNLEVVTTTSDRYETAFGFTEAEVFAAMDEYGLTEKEQVKVWYDGFIFGQVADIYNPWSIINYLDKKKLGAYWANTSSNSLVGKLIRESGAKTKKLFERLLEGEAIDVPVDEQIVYTNLDTNEGAIWSLMLATGYLKVLEYQTGEQYTGNQYAIFKLKLTNEEVKKMFYRMVSDWFGRTGGNYNDFIEALIAGDLKAMNAYMKRVCESVFSYFDTAKGNDGTEPEKFYHGFVLGLMVDMSEEYQVRSNRESGFGRYDVMIYPKNMKKGDAMILEFKVHDPEDEKDLKETVKAALDQIEEKKYEAELIALGFEKENIRKYGFAFEGKKVVIGE